MLKIGLLYNGKTPTEIYFGGNKLHEIWYNGAKIWGKLGVPAKITYDATYSESSHDMLGTWSSVNPRNIFYVSESSVIVVANDIYLLDITKSNSLVTATRNLVDSSSNLIVGSLMIDGLLYISVTGSSGGLYVLDKSLNVQTALKGFSLGNMSTNGDTIFAEIYTDTTGAFGSLGAFKLPISTSTVPIKDSTGFTMSAATKPTVYFNSNKVFVGNGSIEEYAWSNDTLTHTASHDTGVNGSGVPDTGTVFNSDGSMYICNILLNTVTKVNSSYGKEWTYTGQNNLYGITADDSSTLYIVGSGVEAFSVVNPTGSKIYTGTSDVQYLSSGKAFNSFWVRELDQVFLFYSSDPKHIAKFKIAR